MDTQCKAINAQGKPCSAQPRASGYCQWHDPALAAQRAEWRRQGGTARSNRARAKKALPAEALTADEIHAHLGVVFTKVINGEIEPGVATAAANVARAMLDVAKVADFEGQLVELRRSVADLQEERGA